MDELWQRYRTFWTPVLIGLGIFLVGVIAVYVIDADPEETAQRVTTEAAKVRRMAQPTTSQISAQREDARVRKERVAALAQRLDQAGPGKDVVQAAVEQALTAAVLRGGGDDADAFDDDTAAAANAKSRYDRMVKERVDLLRTGDPNVGFSRLLNDVWSELRVRANRADVDLDADQLGFAAVASVNRATLPQRLLNLALASRIVDIAIRSGVRSVDEIRFENRANGGPDSFLLEWPVTFVLTGTMDALRPVLQHLADPAHTTPITGFVMKPPRRQTGVEGLVELTVTASSVRVQPEAGLHLESDEEPR